MICFVLWISAEDKERTLAGEALGIRFPQNADNVFLEKWFMNETR